MNVLSFFSGALGLDLGFESQGFNIKLVCENEQNCQKTIKRNKPDIPLLDDIRQYSADNILLHSGLTHNDPKVIIGGPPCQAFSTIGKRRGLNDARGNVFLYFLKLISVIQPDYLVIENVRGLLYSVLSEIPDYFSHQNYMSHVVLGQKGSVFQLILNILSYHGYNLSYNLYSTAYFGVPQKRERVIIIASKEKQTIPYICPTHDDLNSNLNNFITFQQATQNIEQHTYVNFSKKKQYFYNFIPEGGNWKDLPLKLQKEAMGQSFYLKGGKTGHFRRLSWNKPAPTLVTSPVMNATSLGHPEAMRPLSIEEYKKLQGFSKDYSIEGSLMNQYKQVGNAIPVQFAESIAYLIKCLLLKQDYPEHGYQQFSRYTIE